MTLALTATFSTIAGVILGLYLYKGALKLALKGKQLAQAEAQALKAKTLHLETDLNDAKNKLLAFAKFASKGKVKQ